MHRSQCVKGTKRMHGLHAAASLLLLLLLVNTGDSLSNSSSKISNSNSSGKISNSNSNGITHSPVTLSNISHYNTVLIAGIPIVIYSRSHSPGQYLLEPLLLLTDNAESPGNSTCVNYDSLTQKFHMDFLLTLADNRYELMTKRQVRCRKVKSIRFMRVTSLVMTSAGDGGLVDLQFDQPIINAGGDFAYWRINCVNETVCRNTRHALHSGDTSLFQGILFTVNAEAEDSPSVSVRNAVKQLTYKPFKTLYDIRSFLRLNISSSISGCQGKSRSLSLLSDDVTIINGLPISIFSDNSDNETLWVMPPLLLLNDWTLLNATSASVTEWKLSVSVQLHDDTLLTRVSADTGKTVKFMTLLNYKLADSSLPRGVKFDKILLTGNRMRAVLTISGYDVRVMSYISRSLTLNPSHLTELLKFHFLFSANNNNDNNNSNNNDKNACSNLVQLTSRQLLSQQRLLSSETVFQRREQEEKEPARVEKEEEEMTLVTRLNHPVTGSPLLVRRIGDTPLLLDPEFLALTSGGNSTSNSLVTLHAVTGRKFLRIQLRLRDLKTLSFVEKAIGVGVQFADVYNFSVDIGNEKEKTIFDFAELLMSFGQSEAELRLFCSDNCSEISDSTSPAQVIPPQLRITFTVKLPKTTTTAAAAVNSSISSIKISQKFSRGVTYSTRQLFTLKQITEQLTPQLTQCGRQLQQQQLRPVTLLQPPNSCPVSVWQMGENFYLEPLLCITGVGIKSVKYKKLSNSISLSISLYNRSLLAKVANRLKVETDRVNYMKLLRVESKFHFHTGMKMGELRVDSQDGDGGDDKLAEVRLDCNSDVECQRYRSVISDSTGLLPDKLVAAIKVQILHKPSPSSSSPCEVTRKWLTTQWHRQHKTITLPLPLLNSKQQQLPLAAAAEVNCTGNFSIEANDRLEGSTVTLVNNCVAFTRRDSDLREPLFCLETTRITDNCFDMISGKSCFEFSVQLSEEAATGTNAQYLLVTGVNVTVDNELVNAGFTFDSFTVNAKRSRARVRILCSDKTKCNSLRSYFSTSPWQLLERIHPSIQVNLPSNSNSCSNNKTMTIVHAFFTSNKTLIPLETARVKFYPNSRACSVENTPRLRRYLNLDNGCSAFVFSLNGRKRNSKNRFAIEPLLCYRGNASVIKDYTNSSRSILRIPLVLTAKDGNGDVVRQIRDKLGLDMTVRLEWMQLIGLNIVETVKFAGIRASDAVVTADGESAELRIECDEAEICQRLQTTMSNQPTDYLKTLKLSIVNQLSDYYGNCHFASAGEKQLVTFHSIGFNGCQSQLAVRQQQMEEKRQRLKQRIQQMLETAARLCRQHDFSTCTTRKATSTIYLFSRRQTDWHSAKSNCEYAGAKLAIITGGEENEFVKANARNSWIGLKNHYTGRSYGHRYEPKWINGQFITGYSKANVNSNSDYCYYMDYSGRWIASGCHSSRHYVCEKTLDLL